MIKKRRKPSLLYHKNRYTNDINVTFNKISNLKNVTAIVFPYSELYMSHGYCITKNGGVYYKDTKVFFIDDDKFIHEPFECGLLGIAVNDTNIYLSYTITGNETHAVYLVVNEYDTLFNFIKTVISIGFTENIHHAGSLAIDNENKLWLSTGDGGPQGDPYNYAQDLSSLRGKLLKIDKNKNIEIIAYGLRNPWKFSLSTDGIFIGNVGWNTAESLYFIPYDAPTPVNCGWPYFEGSYKLKNGLSFENTFHPIYEYPTSTEEGRCIIGGYLTPHGYIFGDYLGIVRVLRFSNNKGWVCIKKIKFPHNILSLGYDSKNVYISSEDGIYKLLIERK